MDGHVTHDGDRTITDQDIIVELMVLLLRAREAVGATAFDIVGVPAPSDEAVAAFGRITLSDRARYAQIAKRVTGSFGANGIEELAATIVGEMDIDARALRQQRIRAMSGSKERMAEIVKELSRQSKGGSNAP